MVVEQKARPDPDACGNTAAVEKILAGVPIKEQSLDYFQARAIILAIAGNAAEAIPLLNLGKLRRPYTETRALYSEYQYAEIVEWLYDVTRNVRYRDLALDWVRKCEKSQPWHAWTYAIDAKLSNKGPERNRAIAMTYYLDRKSERLKSIPKAEVDSAVKEFGPRNPFPAMRASLEKKPN